MSIGSDWDRRFSDPASPWSVEPDRLLVELASGLAPGRAVDLGAGTGRNAVWLAAQGWNVTAVDASTVGLRKTAEAALAAGVEVEVLQADLYQWTPPAGAFDLVVMANLHPEPARRDEVFARASEALADGGRLFVIGHHADGLAKGAPGPPDPARRYTEDRLEGHFPGVRLDRLERIETGAADEGGSYDLVLLAWGRKTSAG